MDQTLSSTHQGAFLLLEGRDLFKLDPEQVIFGDLNPSNTGPLFTDSEPEKPDLVSLLQDVPKEKRDRVVLAMKESHTENCEWVQALDSKCRCLYSTAAGLVNDGMKAIRGCGRLVSVLNVQ